MRVEQAGDLGGDLGLDPEGVQVVGQRPVGVAGGGGVLEAEVAADLADLLEAHLEAIDGALSGTAYEGLGPAAGRLVGARDLLRRTVAIGGRPVSDVVPGV